MYLSPIFVYLNAIPIKFALSNYIFPVELCRRERCVNDAEHPYRDITKEKKKILHRETE